MKKLVLSILILVSGIITNINTNITPVEYKLDNKVISIADIPEIIEEPIVTEPIVEEPTTTVEFKPPVVPKEDAIVPVPGIGEIKESATQVDLNKLNLELNNVPSYIRDAFVRSGWHIYVTSENLAQNYFAGKYESVQGITSYQGKYILIENRTVAIKESTIHEFGHFIDVYLNYKSQTDEFKNIYQEEVETFKSRISNPICVSDEREFFAESIYYLYKDPSKLTPKSYDYIVNLLNTI